MNKLSLICQQAHSLGNHTARESAVLRRVADCQTERMGANSVECDLCGHTEIHYNSCRDRHCPLCQGSLRAQWVRSRLKELLPVKYFHVVFTVPKELAPIAKANPRRFYSILFQTAHQTLLQVAARKENLGATIGGLSILHTWDQKLGFHPHIHCIIPAGGMDKPSNQWIGSSDNFFLAVRKLSVVFRGKLLSGIEQSCAKSMLAGDPSTVKHLLFEAAQKDFVVYCKPPFGGPEQVLKYLGRYTHRVGISEQRIVNVENGIVSFSWSDRKNNNSRKILSLTLDEFVRRFLTHLLPRGFRKIRYFGFMANRNRTISLKTVRDCITLSLPPVDRLLPDAATVAAAKRHTESYEVPSWKKCPACGGQMLLRPVPLLHLVAAMTVSSG